MDSTPASLLDRLRQPGQAEAWERFVQLYTPMLYNWARRVGLRDADAADLVQEVFAVLVQQLPRFCYDQNKSFRSWLYTVTLNKWRENNRRRAASLQATGNDGLAEAAIADPAIAYWEAEYQKQVLAQALRLMQAEFQPAAWQAFWKCTIEEKSAVEAAAELGTSPGAVRVAKCRVLARLRQELAGLIE